jgi:hypothetical protein
MEQAKQPQDLRGAMVTYMKNVREPEKHQQQTLEGVITDIQRRKHKDPITRLRAAPPEKYKAYKERLHVICFGGTFTGAIKNDNLALCEIQWVMRQYKNE